MIFRQFEGLFPMPVSNPFSTDVHILTSVQEWFIPGITQSMAWTLLAPYITSCPENNTHLAWQSFPSLNITVGIF